MRCEDCLPLIEEFFDGEVKGGTAAHVRAHLAACETCAAALDALSFEQEVYARYDRGLEVSPTLWSRVSAEIAREPLPESPAPRRPFLSRVREQFAAALGAFAARPALASALALLLVGLTAGSLWLARGPRPEAPVEVAVGRPAAGPVVNGPAPANADGGGAPADNSLNARQADPGHARPESFGGPREVAVAAVPRPAPRTGAAAAAAPDLDLDLLLADSPAADPGIASLGRADEHAVAADAVALFANASASPRDVAEGEARPLDPGEKEMARHVEQAQMLLRSFKNARPAEEGPVDVAYEKSLSRRLLADNATLQLEAEVKGDKETKQVLDRIEPFLLDIANLRDQPSRDEVRSIKERVTKNEIVAALQVY